MDEIGGELDAQGTDIEPFRKSIIEQDGRWMVLADQERTVDFGVGTLTPGWIERQLSGAQWKIIQSNGVKLNPQMINSMAKDAKKGLSKRAIMARHGFPATRWSEWQRKADQGLEPYYLWTQCMFYAAAQVEDDVLKGIKLQAQGDFKAAKWLLEHINPDDYAPTPKEQTVNIHGDVTASQTTNTASVNYMDDDKAKQIAELLQTFKVVPKLDKVIDAEVVEDSDGTS